MVPGAGDRREKQYVGQVAEVDKLGQSDEGQELAQIKTYRALEASDQLFTAVGSGINRASTQGEYPAIFIFLQVVCSKNQPNLEPNGLVRRIPSGHALSAHGSRFKVLRVILEPAVAIRY